MAVYRCPECAVREKLDFETMEVTK